MSNGIGRLLSNVAGKNLGSLKMEIDKTIKGRRSIRRYQDRDIPDSVIKELLSLAIHAPSSMNGQPWCFIVVRAEKTKEHLVEIKNRYCPVEKQDYKADFLRKAPVIIVVCVDKEKSYEREIENGVLATVESHARSLQQGIGKRLPVRLPHRRTGSLARSETGFEYSSKHRPDHYHPFRLSG